MPLEIVTPDEAAPSTSGLRHGVLSPLETLSQSISAIAPTTSPALTIPAVFALAGNGTWLAYALACGATLLMALCIARFARTSASPGSLYQFATSLLPPLGSRTAGWALLLAYTATGSSVVGGFLNYARVLLPAAHAVPASLIVLAATAAATFFAYRDVQASARMMLWIEAASVSMISLVVAALLFRTGLHVDMQQLTLQHVSGSGVRLGVVLALFSFVGFESATTLGHEARNPLRTIPRAVIQSAILAGLFFLTCAYTETTGFRGLGLDLGASQAPFRPLSALAHIPFLGPLIDVGAFVSMFACVLACTTAAARVLLRMAHGGLMPDLFGKTHPRFGTPGAGVILISLGMFLATAALAINGVSGTDMYGWLGSISVFGFLTAYALVAASLPFARKALGQHSHTVAIVSWITVLVMIAGAVGSIYPIPPAPAIWFPYIYLTCMALGMTWFLIRRKTIHARMANP